MNQLRAAARPCARVWFTRQNLCLWAPWEFSRGIPSPRIFQGYSCFSYWEQHLRNLAASGFCQMPKKIRRSPQNEATRLQAQFQTIPSIWQCQCFPASLEILFLLPHGYWVFFTCGRNAERSQMCWGRKCEHWFHSAQKLNWCGWSFQKQVWFSAVFWGFPSGQWNFGILWLPQLSCREKSKSSSKGKSNIILVFPWFTPCCPQLQDFTHHEKGLKRNFRKKFYLQF